MAPSKHKELDVIQGIPFRARGATLFCRNEASALRREGEVQWIPQTLAPTSSNSIVQRMQNLSTSNGAVILPQTNREAFSRDAQGNGHETEVPRGAALEGVHATSNEAQAPVRRRKSRKPGSSSVQRQAVIAEEPSEGGEAQEEDDGSTQRRPQRACVKRAKLVCPCSADSKVYKTLTPAKLKEHPVDNIFTKLQSCNMAD